MEFEAKLTNWIVGYFLASAIIGVVAYLAVLFDWDKIMALHYAMNAINW